MEPDTAPSAKDQQQRQKLLTLVSATIPRRPEGEPETPSSTIAEFGDAADAPGPPSVFESVTNVIQSSHRSRLNHLLSPLVTTLLREGWGRDMIEVVLGELRRDIILHVENKEDSSDALAHHDGVAPMAGEPSSGGWDIAELLRERQLHKRIIALLLSDGEIVAEVRELERDVVSASSRRGVHYEATTAAAAANREEEEEEGRIARPHDSQTASRRHATAEGRYRLDPGGSPRD